MTMIFSDKSRKRLRFGICSTEVTCKMAQNLRPDPKHTNTKPNLLLTGLPPSLSTNNSLLFSQLLISYLSYLSSI